MLSLRVSLHINHKNFDYLPHFFNKKKRVVKKGKCEEKNSGIKLQAFDKKKNCHRLDKTFLNIHFVHATHIMYNWKIYNILFNVYFI